MAKDFLHGQIANGDLVIGDSDQQHVNDVLLAHPGHYKNVPWIGVGIADYLNAPKSPQVTASLEKQIKLMLESDGASKISATVEGGNISIEAQYV